MPRYMTAADRRVVLRDYGAAYQLQTLVETGTSVGDTPWELRLDFQRLYTIELHQETFQAAKRRFAQEPRIKAYAGDSTEVLPQILGEIKGPALFWLDGHYSGPGTARGEWDTPIVQELKIIFSDVFMRMLKHVILIDDARIFEGQPEHNDEPHYADYPTCEWVRDLALKNGYDYLLKDDIMRLTPHE